MIAARNSEALKKSTIVNLSEFSHFIYNELSKSKILSNLNCTPGISATSLSACSKSNDYYDFYYYHGNFIKNNNLPVMLTKRS